MGILDAWLKYYIAANVICLRHGATAKSTTSTDEELTEQGQQDCLRLREKLGSLVDQLKRFARLVHTSKKRSLETLKLIFDIQENESGLLIPGGELLDFPRIGQATKEEVTRVMQARGLDPRVNRAEAFLKLEQWGGHYPEEHPWNETCPRMLMGLRELVFENPETLFIYCGHSPSIELALLATGQWQYTRGLLQPLDTLFLKVIRGRISLLHRLNTLQELGL